MKKRTLAIGIVLLMLAAFLPPVAIATVPVPVLNNELSVTLGFLPPVTHEETIIVRGIHTPGSTIDVRVNGRLEATGTPDGTIYWAEVHLDRGENHVVSYARKDDATASADGDLFRADVSFTDVQNHWAQNEVDVLATLGIVNGLAPGRFGPNVRVTRAEFAKLLVLGLGLEPEEGTFLPFPDAAAIPAWAVGYVAAALHRGLITGFEDGTFRANEPVTRLQMAVLLGRALQFRNYQPTGNVKHFTDDSSLPDWARAELDMAVRAGVIAGFEDGAFRPLAVSTRAQAAVTIYRVWRVTRPTHQN